MSAGRTGVKVCQCFSWQCVSLCKSLWVFSPFELVFGHNVRGPLKVLKEKLLSDDESPVCWSMCLHSEVG